MSDRTKWNRRTFLKGLGAGGAALSCMMGAQQLARGEDEDQTRFLIVIGAGGGASIIDGPLAIARDPQINAHSSLNVFDTLAGVGNEAVFSAVNSSGNSIGQLPKPYATDQASFIRAHYREMVVATYTGSSVNHNVGQYRSVTGGGSAGWGGRTIQEAVAFEHGAEFAIPNVHLALGSGFCQHGTGTPLPPECYGEPVAVPKDWALGLDSSKGLGLEVPAGDLQKARALRAQLEQASRFGGVYAQSDKLTQWKYLRDTARERVEQQDLFSKLSFAQNAALRQDFIDAQAQSFFDDDPFEQQALLAFLLLKHRVSVSVTIGPSFNPVLKDGKTLQEDPQALISPPIAFDFSHQGHRSSQAVMWDRVYNITHGLIELLRSEPYGTNGETLWDRTMIYIATEFGRTRERGQNASEFNSGHHLNNGTVVLGGKKVLQGNRILGGVNAATTMTYGFNPVNGQPYNDMNATTTESELYASLLTALGVDLTDSGQVLSPGLRGNV